MLLAWDLEPSVLRAVLEGPRTGGAHGIDLSLSNDAGVVVNWVNISDVMAEGGHGLDNRIL